MAFRDRTIDFRRVRAGDFLRDPRNWRMHPPGQRQALKSMLERIGIADAVIARETDKGELMLIDGHLRADLDPDVELPTLVVDLDEQEAGELLATLDPLVVMAEVDEGSLRELLDSIGEDADEELQAVLTNVEDAMGLLNVEDYDSLTMPQNESESNEAEDDYVMIHFSVPKAHRKEIIRRIESILTEYEG